MANISLKITKAIILFVFFVSCKPRHEEADYSGFEERQIQLYIYDVAQHKTDSFALLSINLPKRLDTSYEWQRYPSVVRDNIRKHYFLDSKYHLSEEREELYYYLKPADSLYQLTISYLTLKSLNIDTVLPQLKPEDSVELLEQIEDREFNFEKIRWNFKKFKQINDYPFIIAGYQVPSICRKNEMKVSLFGITRIKKRQLTIRAECDAKDTTGFLDNMYKSFLSIRIKENP